MRAGVFHCEQYEVKGLAIWGSWEKNATFRLCRIEIPWQDLPCELGFGLPVLRPRSGKLADDRTIGSAGK
jgi:hypothetical protein